MLNAPKCTCNMIAGYPFGLRACRRRVPEKPKLPFVSTRTGTSRVGSLNQRLVQGDAYACRPERGLLCLGAQLAGGDRLGGSRDCRRADRTRSRHAARGALLGRAPCGGEFAVSA